MAHGGSYIVDKKGGKPKLKHNTQPAGPDKKPAPETPKPAEG